MDTTAPYKSLRHGEMLNWYRIEKILGRGGFGVIYLATDTNLDHLVAIKEYRVLASAGSSQTRLETQQRTLNAEQGMQRFIAEARNLVRFKHPNIVRVMSVFELNGTAYIVMEFEQGQGLRQHLADPENATEAALKSWLEPITDGLAQVHSSGFIHRDIKPANILVRSDGSPVLLDFGSARSSAPVNQETLTALVSEGYAPLEQYSGGSEQQQGPWTDIYALGAVLYFAVSGMEPVDSAKRGSAILNGGQDPLIPAKMLAQGRYSRDFLNAIDWSLQFRINDRPQSLSEWMNAVRRVPFSEIPTQQIFGAHPRFEQNEPDTHEHFVDMSMRDHPAPREVEVERNKRSAKVPRKLPGIIIFWIVLASMGGASWLAYKTVVSPEGNNGQTSVDVGEDNVPDEFVVVEVPSGEEPSQSRQEQLALEQAALDRAEIEAAEATAAEAASSAAAIAARQAEEAARKEAAEVARQELDKVATEKELARKQALLIKQREVQRDRMRRFNRELNNAVQALDEGQLSKAEEALDKAALINGRDGRLVKLRTRWQAALADARTPVSDEDFDEVIVRFDALRRAIESNDVDTMEKLTESSGQNPLFRQLMSRFATLEINIDKIRVRNADKSISASLSINNMIRDNGDHAIPSSAYRVRTITSRRVEGEWSLIQW